MSTTSNNYFLNIDTYYRDVGKYPNPCDFGISFNRFDGTGTFVQGDPLNSSSFFEQASIDPDYKDNNLQFVNAEIQQIDRTTTSLTVSGLYDFTKNFSINYLNINLYTFTGYNYPMTSPFSNSIYEVIMKVPFMCKLLIDNDADIPYSLYWNTYIKPSLVPDIYYNISYKSGFQITTSGNIYWLFDFSLRNFDFYIYKNGIDTYLTSASNPTIDPRTTVQINGNFGNICLCLTFIDGNGDIGIVNNHAYGYHIFSNTFNIDSSESNGNNSIEIDDSDNTYISLNVNPFYISPKKFSNITYNYTTGSNPKGFIYCLSYLYEDSGNTSFYFSNSTGTVVPMINQIAFSPNLGNTSFGAYGCFFMLDDPTQAYMNMSITYPETGTTNNVYNNTSFLFTGTSNELYFLISTVVNLNINYSTGTKIFSVDKNSFQMTQVALIPTTGAASCAFSQLGSLTYIFNQNISNYMDVYTFNTSTNILTRITGIQIPDSYIFTRNIFTYKIGTDIFIYSIPKTSGVNPASFFLLTEGLATILKFDTIFNSISIINTFSIPRDDGYNAQSISFRPSKKYLYSVAPNKNRVVSYDITDPYNIIKKADILSNSINAVFSLSQTINSITKYYLIISQIGGGSTKEIYDITNVDNPSKIGNNIEGYGVYFDGGDYITFKDNYVYSTLVFPATDEIGNKRTFIKSPLPFLEQTTKSTQINQNIARTFTSPTSAVRCTTFNLNDQSYVAFISSTYLTIYNITSIRSAFLVSSIPFSIPTTIYDIKSINFNNSQYFIICCLGIIFTFILDSSLSFITLTGLFNAIPDAFAEASPFILNNNLYAVITSYSSRLYKFIFNPLFTLTQPPVTILAGKIPAIVLNYFEVYSLKQYIAITTSNFATSSDIYYYYDITSSIILLGTRFGTPGAMPRSGSSIVDSRDSSIHASGYANVGWGAYFPNSENPVLGGFTFQNVQAINIPTYLNGATRYFYTDRPYIIINQYGGAGSLGDYITCFDMSNWKYGVQVFQDNISIAGTGVSTGSPAFNLDLQISQNKDRTTLVSLNTNGSFYLYDISNPYFAGSTQNIKIINNDISIPANFGYANIFKLNKEGGYLFNNQIRSFNNSTGINGSLINSSNIKISSDNLNFYVSGGFIDQIQLFNPNSLSPVNQIQTFGLNYNAFIAKCNAITGEWIWILPIYGSLKDYLQKIQYISSLNKIICCGYTTSKDLLIYQKQNAGSLVNPILFQSTIKGSVSNTIGFLILITSDGIVNWFTTSYSDESSVNVNFLDVGTQNNQIVVSGYTNASVIQTIDSSGLNVQNLYTKSNILIQNSFILYYFNTNGIYQKSQFIVLPELTSGFVSDIKIFSDLNTVSFISSIDYNANTLTSYYNKDGTLAHTDTGPVNAIVSYITDYLNESRYIDSNGNYYSSIKLKNIPTYPFTGGFMSNYNMYILGYANSTTLNKNFSIRDNFIASTGDYRIILNSSINTSTIDRNLFIVNNITGSNDFYNINISSSPLSSIFEYNIGDMPTINNTITTSNLSNLDTSLQYYITIPKYNQIYSYPVLNISTDVNGDYVFQLDNVNDLRISTGGSFYGPYLYLTQFNQNIFYNLQFFPASLNLPVFYTIQLNSLVLPNRPLRQSPNNFVRNLTDMPYIYIAIYSVDEFDIPDDEIVNIVYDNNPNRERIEIFQLNTINAGDTSNFVTYTTSVRPRVKFNSSFTTLRIKLFDRYGNILLFDNTPYKTSDSRFTNSVVPDQLMNISIQFLLTKI